MAETLTNKALNTATITNPEFSSASLTWDEAEFTWDEAAGTWDNPYNLANQAVNDTTITNKALS